MLVVSANWMFGDGTLAAAAAAPYASVWLQAVHRAAVRAGFRRDGSYRPLDEVQIVLAGDTFDCLTTTAWTGRLRPWHDGRAAQAARRAVLMQATRRGRRLLARFSRWARHGLPVPTADRRGRPVLTATTQVPVRIALLAGDRDSWLDEACSEAARYGLSVGSVWSDDRTTVRHGLESDPCLLPGESRRANGRGWQPTIGESVAVDLVARFAAAVMAAPAASMCRPLIATLAASGPLELPAALGPWLDSSRGTAARAGEHREALVTLWWRSVADWHRQAMRQPPVSPTSFAVCDALAAHFDAIGRGLGERVGRDVCELLAPRSAAAPTSATVLGHPPATCSMELGWARVICLGPTIASAWGLGGGAHRPGPPPTVVSRPHGWGRLQMPGMDTDRPLLPATPTHTTVIDAA
ncbi:MAG: hypothetical protein WCC69_14635 [Pirellulales bacterium]